MRLFWRFNVIGVEPEGVDDRETQDSQNEERHGHALRGLVCHVVHLLITRFTEKGHENETEHIERRNPSGKECHAEQEIMVDGVPFHCASQYTG